MVNSVASCPTHQFTCLRGEIDDVLRTSAVYRVLKTPDLNFGVIENPYQLRISFTPCGRKVVNHVPHGLGANHNV